MANRDHLFKPGQSGNPAGRPKKGECLTDILRNQAALLDVDTTDGPIARREALSRKLWAMAMTGDMAAIKYIYDRIDGKPRESMDLDMTQRVEGDINIIRPKR